MGGANVIDQSLAARPVDQLRIDLSPLVLGEGTRLFDLAWPDDAGPAGGHRVTASDASHLRGRQDLRGRTS